MNFVACMAQNVISNRRRAKDKERTYDSRLMYDRSAAAYEKMLIDYANFLIRFEEQFSRSIG